MVLPQEFRELEPWTQAWVLPDSVARAEKRQSTDYAEINSELLHEGRADAHGHDANHLRARRLGIQDAARGAHREHASDAGLARGGVDGNLDEMRPKR